jgi:hypothetical protein
LSKIVIHKMIIYIRFTAWVTIDAFKPKFFLLAASKLTSATSRLHARTQNYIYGTGTFIEIVSLGWGGLLMVLFD